MKKPRISLHEADQHYKTAHNLYREIVAEAVQEHGSAGLGELLGMDRTTILSIVRRDRITKLRELAKRVRKGEK